MYLRDPLTLRLLELLTRLATSRRGADRIAMIMDTQSDPSDLVNDVLVAERRFLR